MRREDCSVWCFHVVPHFASNLIPAIMHGCRFRFSSFLFIIRTQGDRGSALLPLPNFHSPLATCHSSPIQTGRHGPLPPFVQARPRAFGDSRSELRLNAALRPAHEPRTSHKRASRTRVVASDSTASRSHRYRQAVRQAGRQAGKIYERT